MLVPLPLLVEAKRKHGETAIPLIREHLNLQKFDEQNLKASCPFGHADETPSFIWNPKENSFHCFSCGRNYGIIDLYMEQGMTYLQAVGKLFSETGIDFRMPQMGLSTSREYKHPKFVENHNNRKTVEAYWKLRGISPETLDFCGVTEDEEGNAAFHFFDEHDVLMVVKYRPSRKIEKGQTKFWVQKDCDKAPVLYGMERIDPSQPLLIVEGEPDRLSVVEAGFRNVVSVPFGAGAMEWIEHNFDWLEQFKQIIIWSDNDDAGTEMRRKATSRLGVWRTLVVILPTSLEKDGKQIPVKDANEVLYHFGGDKVLSLIADAQEVPVENIANLVEMEDFELDKAEGLYTPFSELNDALYKLVMGTVVVVTGKPGAGKSTLINQMFIAEPLNQGLDVFAYSGEMSASILKKWLETTMIGREFVTVKDKHIRTLEPKMLAEMRQWYNHRVWIFDNPIDNNVETIMGTAEAVVRRYGVKVIVLDNLMKIDIGATSEKDIWQCQKKFIVRLCSFAETFGVLVVLVAHPRKTAELRRLVADDVAGSSDIGNLAHYIFGVHRYSAAEKKGKKDGHGNYKKGYEPIPHDNVIELFKNRITGIANIEVPLYFDFQSYRFYTSAKELWKRLKFDKRTTPVPTHDPNNHAPEPEFIHP